jgi:hypothetical protein
MRVVNDPEVRMPWLLVHLCLVFGRAGDVFMVTGGGLGTALLPRLLGTCSVPTYACKDPWFKVHPGVTVAAGILAMAKSSCYVFLGWSLPDPVCSWWRASGAAAGREGSYNIVLREIPAQRFS